MKKLGILVLAALIVFGVQLYAQPAEGKMCKNLTGKMKLTDEQKKDIDKIHVQMEKKMIDQKAKSETAKLELKQLLKADNPDKSAIEKKLNEIATLDVQTHMIRIDSWFAVNKLLTPEQQKIWKKALETGPAMEKKMMNRKIMKDRKGSRGPMPAPQPPEPPSEK